MPLLLDGTSPQAGADPRAVDARGRTPLAAAIRVRAWLGVPPLLRADMSQLAALNTEALLNCMIADDEDQEATLAIIALLSAAGRYRHPRRARAAAPQHGRRRGAGAPAAVTLPLHAAVLKQRDCVVQALVASLGADPDAPFTGNLREPPLAVAAAMFSPISVAALLRSGASPHARDAKGWSPLATCVRRRSGDAPGPDEYCPDEVYAKRSMWAAHVAEPLRRWAEDLPPALGGLFVDRAAAARRERADTIRYLILRAADLIDPDPVALATAYAWPAELLAPFAARALGGGPPGLGPRAPEAPFDVLFRLTAGGARWSEARLRQKLEDWRSSRAHFAREEARARSPLLSVRARLEGAAEWEAMRREVMQQGADMSCELMRRNVIRGGSKTGGSGGSRTGGGGAARQKGGPAVDYYGRVIADIPKVAALFGTTERL
jgi:hypothetical protein